MFANANLHGLYLHLRLFFPNEAACPICPSNFFASVCKPVVFMWLLCASCCLKLQNGCEGTQSTCAHSQDTQAQKQAQSQWQSHACWHIRTNWVSHCLQLSSFLARLTLAPCFIFSVLSLCNFPLFLHVFLNCSVVFLPPCVFGSAEFVFNLLLSHFFIFFYHL